MDMMLYELVDLCEEIMTTLDMLTRQNEMVAKLQQEGET